MILSFISSNSEDKSNSNLRPAYSQPSKKYNDYKSTKPVRDMDGWEIKQFNEAWDKMSPDEKKKQIYRDLGDVVNIQE